jgi:hydroxymethylpyrimidine pyrophosphatase-like HAD family hydrolase
MNLTVSPSPEHPVSGELSVSERDGLIGGENLLPVERNFYQGYSWCLNPFPTVGETVELLKVEIARLGQDREPWQAGEVMTNVYLLSSAVLNAVEEYLRGKTVRLPRALGRIPLARALRWVTEKGWAVRHWRQRARVQKWREKWCARLDEFLSTFVAGGVPEEAIRSALIDPLQMPLPAEVRAEPIYFPSAFRRLDLTPLDVLELGRLFMGRFSERGQAILLLGLRTAGTYFAPLLRAFLWAEGYQHVEYVTVHTEKGPSPRERAELKRCARSGYRVVILDDPPHSGDTIAFALDLAIAAGFGVERVVALVPAHPARRDWGKALSLAGVTVLSLMPEDWHKERLLEPKAVEKRLAEYFRGRSLTSVRLAEELNAPLQACSEDARRARLKRVYEVGLQTPEGESETCWVLAKSVGWGWLGYHAFLTGQRLSGLVPPLLGLRDGILYSQWLPQATGATAARDQWIATAASYVAARARWLRLEKNPLPGLGRHRHQDGIRLLEKIMSRAYGRFLTAGLMRPRLRRRLAEQPCPLPALIDGKMQRAEWINGPAGLLKTDHEHHGMGKSALNALDPVYDLAETILHLGLSEPEEMRLLQRYREESGDGDVGPRLFMNKFLAGTWATTEALKCLFQPGQSEQRQREFSQRFVDALHFLTVHTARHCGALCRPAEAPVWRSPVAVLDVDGVLDRWVFGFPCTSAAGIEALALLHAHQFSIALDTARSVDEVREYCRAYGLAGGVAEYGSYVWDAVEQRGQVLVSPESQRQLDQAREALRRLPGMFLDERYRFIIRAFTYEDRGTALGRLPIPSPLRALLSLSADDRAPVPVPALAVQQVLASLGLDRLCVQQTTMDTTIRAREVNKGSGLTALLAWAGVPQADTTAVGDSEPDLPMFRAAKRSFAPAHISCARLARLIGCRVVRQPCQRGLLEIARSLVHPGGGRCPRCASGEQPWPKGQDLFLDLLRAADRRRWVAFLRALFDPRAYRIFVR